MPKRSIQAFQPKGLRSDRFYSDDDIKAIIAAAGGMPSGEIDDYIPIDGHGGFRYEARRIPRRQALSERLEQAASAYTVSSEFQAEPTAKQIAGAMADIGAAAAKLIAALHLPEATDQDPFPSGPVIVRHSDPDGPPKPLDQSPLASMPDALRYGALQAYAEYEAEQLGGLPRWSGEGLLRDSVHGVYRLHRWARSVQARCRTARQTPRAKRYAGNEELDHLFGDLAGIWIDVFHGSIATSVGNPESANAGQAGGPMIRFFIACLKPILKGKTPSNDAIRARIRRLFPAGALHKLDPREVVAPE